MFQWWIDTIGKLGPGIIAVLVLFTTRRQNNWQNMAALRAAQVEDQKFRLALLDRRDRAIERVEFAVRGFWIEGAARADEVQAIAEALRIAELVFDDSERAEIEGLLKQLYRWQGINRQINTYRNAAREGDGERYQRCVELISQLEGELLDGFTPIVASLKRASRIQSVASIGRPPKLSERIKRGLRWKHRADD